MIMMMMNEENYDDENDDKEEETTTKNVTKKKSANSDEEERQTWIKTKQTRESGKQADELNNKAHPRKEAARAELLKAVGRVRHLLRMSAVVVQKRFEPGLSGAGFRTVPWGRRVRVSHTIYTFRARAVH